jgi:hypothetical protein
MIVNQDFDFLMKTYGQIDYSQILFSIDIH